MKLLPPMRFRLDESDHEQYGADWCVYDEAAMLRVPARELVDIERRIGMPLVQMIERARAGYTDATLAALWVARRLAGHDEPFADFAPLALLARWERPAAGDANPPAPTSSTSAPGA